MRVFVFLAQKEAECNHFPLAMGREDDFRRRTFHDYFAEGKDIAQLPVLENIVAKAGLPADEVWDELTLEPFAPAVEEDWPRARQMGGTVVPFYLYGDKLLVGYRPYGELLKFIDGN